MPASCGISTVGPIWYHHMLTTHTLQRLSDACMETQPQSAACDWCHPRAQAWASRLADWRPPSAASGVCVMSDRIAMAFYYILAPATTWPGGMHAFLVCHEFRRVCVSDGKHSAHPLRSVTVAIKSVRG